MLRPRARYHCAVHAGGTISQRSALNDLLVAAGGWNDWKLRAEGSQVGPEDLYEVFILDQ